MVAIKIFVFIIFFFLLLLPFVRGGKFRDNSRAQKIRGAGKNDCSAPAQGTPQAFNGMESDKPDAILREDRRTGR
jgi:hypothetical protein